MNPTGHSLLILLWNANGLRHNLPELELLLNDRRIDVALLCETHLTGRSYLRVPGYTAYRTDHPDGSSHGGTAILVRQRISHHPLPSTSTESLQSTSISIKCFPFPLSLSAVYCPPNKPLTHAHLLSHFQSLGPHFVSGGDYNAKHPRWGSRLANPRGRILQNLLNTQNFNFLSPNSYTYWPADNTRLPDLLDFFVTSGTGPINSSVSTLTDLSSDHSPVLLTLQLQPIARLKLPTLTPGPMNWDMFQSLLDSRIDLKVPLKTPSDIDTAVHVFTKAVQESAWGSTRPQRSVPSDPPPSNLPQEVRLLLAAKRRARKTWQDHCYPSDRLHFRQLSRLLHSKLQTLRSERVDSQISSLTSQNRSLWTATKRLLRFHHISSPLRRSDGSWARSDTEKADEFASHLHTTFQPHPDVLDPVHSAHVHDFLTSPLPLSLPPRAITPADVRYVISRLLPRKSPGVDLITSEILRHFPRRAIVFLTYIYNSILRTTHFPLLWKFSVIKLIPKPDKPLTEPSSFRPISLLPLFSKIFEKILIKRLLPIFDSQGIIPSHQFGFRSSHSTVQQCFRLVDKISSSLERGQYCGGVFLDVAQAFDRVWHPGLLFKLKKILPSTYYLILKSYLEDRFFRVNEAGEYSSYFPIEASVPQGSVLAPLLYSVYTADIPTHDTTLLATFADDTCILSSNPDPITTSNNLQNHLHEIENWCRRWRVKVNGAKSAHLTFALRRQPCPPLTFNTVPIPSPEHTRYLGLYLDKRLTWNPHTRLKRIDLNRKFGLLRRLMNSSSKLSLQNKINIYKVILKPTWTYGVELWGSAKPANIQRIQSFQSKVLRTILNAPWYVSNHTTHNDLNIPTVTEVITAKFQKFHSSLSYHPNPLAQSLSTPNHPLNPPRRLRRQWPRDLL